MTATVAHRHDLRGGDRAHPSRWSPAAAHPSEAAVSYDVIPQLLAKQAHSLTVLAEHGGSIAFADRSGFRRGGFPVHLDELGDPDLARGNCWAATNELLDRIDPEELGATAIDEITLTNRRDHVAISATDGKTDWVVDYTIRQFDAELAFPWVGTEASWKSTIEVSTGQTWAFT
ncbi:hypothetical protein [Leifsonia sp. Leaf264]|uniref:hypothetical protein n=1 Tax=Leifsonia sp. Leaf264 TaxID=1736314 RepID=UPI0007022720|nr:hypothetical protein [Leifsonia sp. Leaf264]KQO98179.1 hypothetical protein ASF30_08960 [Leifsonia sp. Leaf264]